MKTIVLHTSDRIENKRLLRMKSGTKLRPLNPNLPNKYRRFK